jgi:hypothetical protein
MADDKDAAAVKPSTITLYPPAIGPLIALDPKEIERGGGMYQAHGLERHVNTYALTDSDLDLLESTAPLFAISIAVASFFGSTVLACALAGATFSSRHDWNAQQWGLFYYAPLGAGCITAVAAILAVITGIRQSKAKTRIKKESYVPGTYVPDARANASG